MVLINNTLSPYYTTIIVMLQIQTSAIKYYNHVYLKRKIRITIRKCGHRRTMNLAELKVSYMASFLLYQKDITN